MNVLDTRIVHSTVVTFLRIARTLKQCTKNGWRKQGYKVDKDAVPVTTVPLYIYAPHNVYDKKNGKVIGKKKMLFVWANFYTQSQVTEIKTRSARV